MRHLRHRAHRVAEANLAFVTTVIIALVTCDVLFALPLPLGVAGHDGSTVVAGRNRRARSGPPCGVAPRRHLGQHNVGRIVNVQLVLRD